MKMTARELRSLLARAAQMVLSANTPEGRDMSRELLNAELSLRKDGFDKLDPEAA